MADATVVQLVGYLAGQLADLQCLHREEARDRVGGLAASSQFTGAFIVAPHDELTCKPADPPPKTQP